MNTPNKGCPYCKYPIYDVHAPALVRMSGSQIKYVHSPEMPHNAKCICQGCDDTFTLDMLVDITEKDLINDEAVS